MFVILNPQSTNVIPHWYVARRLRRPMLLLLGFALAYFGFCAYLAHAYLHPSREVYDPPEGVQNATVGTTPVWATPGLLEGRPSRVVFVLAHGYGGTRATWNGLLEHLRKAGIDAVAPAMPGQDSSPDPTVGFGAKEARTILDCAAWARSKGAKRVVGLGISLGGGATWLASALEPEALDGVISDASFAQFDEAMNRLFSYKLPFPGGATLLHPVVWFARAMSGIDPYAIRPVDAAAKWRGRPALVIQGDADEFIVPSNGRRLADAAGCPLWLVPGANHAEDYPTAPEEYARRVVEFARKL